MPTARQPRIFAICPTADPPAPAAVETSTVSPGLGSPIVSSPTSAVTPFMPRTPSASEYGRSVSFTRRTTDEGATSANSCQPNHPVTISPGRNSGHLRLRDLAHRQRPHNGTDLDGGRIVAPVGDPAAHRRIDRQKGVADANVSFRQDAEFGFADSKILRLRHAVGTRDEDNGAAFHSLIPIACRAFA